MSSEPSAHHSRPRIYYGYIVVAAIFLIMVFAFGANFAFGVFFKPVQTEFGWTRTMTAAAFSLCMLVQGAVGIVMGGLTDKFGPRLVMSVSGILLGLGYFLMSHLGSLWQLYLFYGGIIGVGMSSGYVTLLSTTARWFDKNRNLMTGIVLIGMSLGTLLAPPISEWLISSHDWRSSYLITAVVVGAVVIIGAQFLKRDPSKVAPPVSVHGKEDPAERVSDSQGFSLKEAASRRQFWLFVGTEVCFGFILFSLMVHIVPHATDLNISPGGAAAVLAAMGGFSILGRLGLGRAADKFGNKAVFLLGFVLLVIALLWLSFARVEWMLFAFAALFGIAYGGMETSESPMTAWLFGMKSHGLVFGSISFFFTVGASIGPVMTGYIFDATGGYRLAFLILAGIGLVGLIFTATLRSLIKPPKGAHQ